MTYVLYAYPYSSSHFFARLKAHLINHGRFPDARQADARKVKPHIVTNQYVTMATSAAAHLATGTTRSTTSSMMIRPAPQLVFDDGSRVMHEVQSSSSSDVTAVQHSRQRRQDSGLSLTEFYEIHRLADTIWQYFRHRKRSSSSSSSNNQHSVLRIALQFPDELLCDAPMVCWEMEQRFRDLPALAGARTFTTTTAASAATESEEENAASHWPQQVLVFCLGDTTYADCCPDFVAAAHLRADCIVHYGHACLSSSSSSSTASHTEQRETQNRIPVFYSLGRAPLDLDTCVSRVVDQVQRHDEPAPVRRLLLLYQVCYHYAVEELQTRLSEQGDLLVIAGQILSDMNDTKTSNTGAMLRPEGAQEEEDETHSCGCGQRSSDACEQRTHFSTSIKETVATLTPDVKPTADREPPKSADEDTRPKHLVVGGLELPSHLDWSTFTLLYIGDDSSRQYLNIVLRFLSSGSDGSPQQYWTYEPITNELRTSLSATFQRKLQRRFYLVQKARQASILGILIANVSSPHSRTVATTLRDLIHDHNRSSYTFCVGKINPAKLANFPEVDAFVLVACPEHALLDNDSEYPVPVLTPLELTIALSMTEWGEQDYSLDAQDFVKLVRAVARNGKSCEDHMGNEDDDSDAPFYSLVTGRYEAAPKSREQLPKSVDLTALPGEGQLTTYNSATAEFFKQREYQGLQVQAGATHVQVAQPGQQGIASNYGER